MNTAVPCPTCGRTTTQSSIGHVCVNCEKIWPYDTQDKESSPQAHLSTDVPLSPPTQRDRQYPTTPEPTQSSDTAYAKISPSYQINHEPGQTAAEMQAGYEYSLRTRLKRLVVPELPSGIDESRSLESASESSSPTKIVEQVKEIEATPLSTPPVAAEKRAALLANLSASTVNDHPASTVMPLHPTDPTLADLSSPPPKSSPKPSEEPDDGEKTNSQSVLLSTVGVIIAVIAIGAWLTLHNRSAPVKTPTPNQPTATQPNSNQSDKEASADEIKRDAQRKKDLHDIATALEVYRQQQGSYPVGEDIAVLYPLQYTTPPYISFVNYDPLSSNDKKIKYAYSSNGSRFTLQAKLENSADTEGQNSYYSLKSK